MKKHNFKTINEIITAMMDGQVFWYGTNEIYFDSSSPQPFRCGDHAALKVFWEDWEKWQIKSHWTDDLSVEHPVLCWVKNPGMLHNIIVTIHSRPSARYYIDTTDKVWGYAEPVKPEECWQGDE